MSRNKSSIYKKSFKALISAFLVLIIFYQLGSVIFPSFPSYLSPYYTEEVYKNLENVFNHSQYRIKVAPAIIPDETVFSYAAGAYLRGVDPIYINSEHTPLGKYFIALSILAFKNDKTIIIPAAILTLFALWLLGKLVFEDAVLALIPVIIMSSEKLFLNQLRITPLLDIIQLPFIFLSMYFFVKEDSRSKYWFTALFLGIVMATKTIVPGLLLISTFCLYLILRKNIHNLVRFIAFLPISGLVFILSYSKTFLDGYTFWDFIGFQKWIFLYQKSRLIFPFSVWRLIFLNQWQTWWGDMRFLKAEDWQITWPVFTAFALILLILVFTRRLKLEAGALLLIIWFIVYSVFLSLGTVVSRFLLPFLPIAYILGVYLVRELFLKVKATMT